MSDFKREDRYLVFKNSDLRDSGLSYSEQMNLCKIIDKVCAFRLNSKRPLLECVVVESDWEIYDQVWKLVEEESLKK